MGKIYPKARIPLPFLAFLTIEEMPNRSQQNWQLYWNKYTVILAGSAEVEHNLILEEKKSIKKLKSNWNYLRNFAGIKFWGHQKTSEIPWASIFGVNCIKFTKFAKFSSPNCVTIIYRFYNGDNTYMWHYISNIIRRADNS